MRPRPFPFLPSLAAVILCSCAKAPTDPARLAADADALDRGFFEAANKGDIAGMMAGYWNSPEVLSIQVTGGALQPARGFQAIETALKAALAAMPGVKAELIEQHNEVQGDVVLGWGKYRASGPADSGQAVGFVACYSDVKAVRGGRLVYIYDHTYTPCEPAPGPAPAR